MLKITLLGTGGSGGVPLLGGPDEGGEWGECDPAEPRNRRTRTAALIESASGGRLLIDAGPDLRTQLLAARAGRVDAVVFTAGAGEMNWKLRERVLEGLENLGL